MGKKRGKPANNTANNPARNAPPKPAGAGSALRRWYADKAPFVDFGWKFCVLTAVFYLLLQTPFSKAMISNVTVAQARLSGAVLNLLGQHNNVDGATMLKGTRAVIRVDPLCSGFDFLYLYIAAVAVFPAAWRKKLAGVLIGVPLLMALNLVRIASLFVVNLDFPSIFDLVHEEIWAFLLISATIALYIFWMRWAARPNRKRSMPRRNPIAIFLCVFVLLYVALVMPWPRWGGFYGGVFRAAGNAVFGGGDGLRLVTFEPLEDPKHPSATRIIIVNRGVTDPNAANACDIGIDALATGWKPVALLLALILATPVSWKRRGWALLWGSLCVHAFVLLFLAFSIWNRSTVIGLAALSPFWKEVADGFNELMISQFSLVIPAVVWVLVTFRREDLSGSIGRAIFGTAGDGKEAAAEKAGAKAGKPSGGKA